MNNNTKAFYIIVLILFIIFLIIFLSSSKGYYEYSNSQKKTITDKKIKQFEEDIKNGKDVNINDYYKVETKNYNNNITRIGDDMNLFINKSINYMLESSFKVVEKMID